MHCQWSNIDEHVIFKRRKFRKQWNTVLLCRRKATIVVVGSRIQGCTRYRGKRVATNNQKLNKLDTNYPKLRIT